MCGWLKLMMLGDVAGSVGRLDCWAATEFFVIFRRFRSFLFERAVDLNDYTCLISAVFLLIFSKGGGKEVCSYW
jgi:hypothetical protein